jgi:hypothetical protein
MKTKYLYLFFAIIPFFFLACENKGSQTPSKEDAQLILPWIDDQINYLPLEEKRKLASLLHTYYQQTGNQVKVILLSDFAPLPTMGRYLRKYAQDNRFSSDSSFMLVGLAIHRGIPDVFPNWRMKQIISQKEIDEIMQIIVNAWADQAPFQGLEKMVTYLQEHGTVLGETFLQMSMPAFSLEQALQKPDSTFRLDLRGQKLTSFPKEILQLKNLNELWLSKNQIKEIPEEIGQLTQLQNLDLSNNQIHSLPESLKKLTYLKKLNLTKNPLENPKQVFALITSLPKLTSLEMNFCNLTQLPPEISKLSKLTDLQLVGNQIQSIPTEVGLLSNLQVLLLNRNNLTTLPNEIGKLARLQLLYADSNRIAQIPSQIGELQKLTVLRLQHNQLRLLPQEIGKLTTLEKLYIADNQIDSISSTLKSLTQLKEISINKNPISEEEKKKLSRQFPQLKIW